jgi:hypothetical protein
VTDIQLYLAIGVTVILNTVAITLLAAHMNSRFDAVNQRFDDMRDLWRSELRRVEEVLDARFKHLEQNRR